MLGRPVAFRRRYVRTAEGSRRYELPIGSPIEAHDQPGGGRHRAPETSDSPGPASLPATLRPASQPSPEELAADYREQAQLTPDEVAIVDAYQGPGLYKKINKRLRTGEQLAGRPAEVAAGLEQVMAKHTTSQPLRVYRGMGSFVPDDTSPGAVIDDPGFSSSTLSEDVAKEFAGDGVSLDITVPSGFNAVVVNGVVDDPNLGWEKELLLPRGTRYVVLSEEEREGKRWLNVVALPPTGGQPLVSSGSQASGTTATRGSFLAIGRRVRKPSTPSPLAGSPLGSSGARRTGPRADGGVWFAVRYVRTAAGSRRYGVPIGSPIPTGRKVRNRSMPDGSTRLRLTPAQRAVAGRVFGEDSGSNGASHAGGVSLDVDNPTAAAKALDGLASDDLTPGQRRTVRVLRDKIAGLTGPDSGETSEDTGQPGPPDTPETPASDTSDMPGDPATAPARRAIRDAYDELAPPDRTSTSGDPAWIGLADLRKQLGEQGLSRGEVDAALTEMASEPGVHLQAEANQRSLTPEDRAAGITVGGDTRHLIRIEQDNVDGDAPSSDDATGPSAPNEPAPVSAAQVADEYRSKVTLSRAENRALSRWNSSAFSMINGYLRGGQGTEGGAADAQAMEALMGRYELPGPATAFRALGPDVLPVGDQTGRVITSPGFSSVALDRPAGGAFADRTRYPVLMELDIPEGMNGIAVEGTEHAWPDQREFVLPNNSRFVVESDVTEGGVRYVKATVQPPEVSP